MKLNPDIIQEREEHFQKTLKKSGVKMTVQRMEIYKELAGTGSHPDAETIFKGVRRKIPMVSLDTVYRTLWLFLDLGLIATVGQSKERARFDANILQHHHFVCRQCGKMQDFYSDSLNSLALPNSIEEMGLVEKTLVEVLGLCAGCLSKTDNP